jgi:hypothetical protein
MLKRVVPIMLLIPREAKDLGFFGHNRRRCRVQGPSLLQPSGSGVLSDL